MLAHSKKLLLLLTRESEKKSPAKEKKTRGGKSGFTHGKMKNKNLILIKCLPNKKT